MNTTTPSEKGPTLTRLLAFVLEGLKLVGIALVRLALIGVAVIASAKTGIVIPRSGAIVVPESSFCAVLTGMK